MSEKKIGLLFAGDSNWMGGVYYTVNVLESLKSLPVTEQPFVYLFYNKSTPEEVLQTISYSKLKMIRNEFFKPFKRLLKKVSGKAVTGKDLYASLKLDGLFPVTKFLPFYQDAGTNVFFWIYDFQHKFLPEMFYDEENKFRDENFENMATHAKHIVVSSHDAAGHFKKFFPQSKAMVHVLQFVSLIDFNQLPNEELIREKYKITGPYFLVSNQFWKHKNHTVVLEALKLLKEKNVNAKIIFTGKEHDPRNPDYVNGLKKFISDNQLQNHISMLGFMPRYDQLALMKYAHAAIQPSKFEGWSTVVEDAKSLSTKIILSNLAVHHEQCGDKALYFDVNDAASCAEHISFLLSKPKEFVNYGAYADRVNSFAGNFIRMFAEKN